MRSGGLSDDVLRLALDIEGFEFISLSIPDEFVRAYGSYGDHCKQFGLTSENLVNKVKDTFTSLIGY